VTPTTLTWPSAALADAAVEPVPTPDPDSPSCEKASEVCEFIWTRTGQAWLADSSYYLLLKPATIVLILVGALVARYILHRVINKLVGGHATVFSPLRDRMPLSLQEATGLRSERRRQRAEALASVLRSVASITVFSIATLMILAELGVNLAPLLASAGVAGVAIGFGAQNVVKDFLAGLFMLLEDQYGVGDVIDVGEANGTVEAVGLRITTIRDAHGVVWYIRNGEIVRVGNKSQGWAAVVVDVPIGFANVEEATTVLAAAAASLAEDEQFADDLLEPPRVLGVEQITVDGAVVRIRVRTSSEAQWRIGRELRRRASEALERAGIAQQMSARLRLRPEAPADPAAGAGVGEAGVSGPT
jgi:small conductance mechanosensitive channel